MVSYDIKFKDMIVGQAEVDKVGLFYRIVCRCRLAKIQSYRIVVQGDGGEEDLGILIPNGEQYVLTASFPVKRIGDHICGFYITERNQPEHRFVEILEDRPFLQLELLEKCYCGRNGNRTGVYIKD